MAGGEARSNGKGAPWHPWCGEGRQRGERERESERRQAREAERKLGLSTGARCPHRREEKAGAHGIHGGACSHAWRTRGHFVEHVAGDGVTSLGSYFGPFLVRSGPWALNKVCCNPYGLQLSLRASGH